MQFLSERALSLQESATLAMSRKTRELKAQGQDVISLSLGEPNFPTPSYICESAISDIKSGDYFSYPPVGGYADVRAVVAEKFFERKRHRLQSRAHRCLNWCKAMHCKSDVCYAKSWRRSHYQQAILGKLPRVGEPRGRNACLCRGSSRRWI